MLPIGFWFAGFFSVRALILLEAVPRRGIPDFFIPGIFIPDMLLISCFFVIRLFLVATLFLLTVVFRLAFALGFDIFIPGIFCMSWPCASTLAVDVSIRPIIMTVLNPESRMKAPTLNLFIVLPLKILAQQKPNTGEDARTEAHASTK